MTSNRLAGSASPYLTSHAQNPVHWQPWGPEAFAEARRRDVPVLVSIGYATCHWCHVMAAESFSDPELAELINSTVVAVKVDREQHPAVDAYYMQATVALSGQGGWPMTVFTDGDGRPFFADTYFPPVANHGRPSFRQVLDAVGKTWSTERPRVADLTGRLNEAIRSGSEEDGAGSAGSAGSAEASSWSAQEATAQLPTRVVQKMRASETPSGGFGGAPKFPPSAALLGLVRWAERTDSDAAAEEVLDIAGRTVSAMLQGGLFDPVEGGFHRYCVDESWTVPHFEKSLYDNALLLRALAAYSLRRPEDALAAEAVELTRGFLTDGLRVPGTTVASGDRDRLLFASGLDADTRVDGRRVEGYTYTWEPGELKRFGLSGEGDVDGRVVLTRRDGRVVDDETRRHLADERARRPRPDVDGKVVTAWNAMAAVALAEAGDPAFARATVDVWNHAVLVDGGNPDTDADDASGGATVLEVLRCAGEPQAPGTLEDCAWLLMALVRLWEHHGPSYAGLDVPSAVSELVRYTQLAFHRGPGTWYDAPGEIAGTGVRPRDPYDGATPSAVAVLAEALSFAGTLATSLEDADIRTVGGRWSAEARRILDAHQGVVARHLGQAGGWLCALEVHFGGPVQATVRLTDVPDSGRDAAARVVRRDVGTSGLVLSTHHGARLVGSAPQGPVVQVCRAGVCEVPRALPLD